MKRNLIWLIILVMSASCTVNRKLSKVSIGDREKEDADSTVYELIIFDPEFESWFISHSKPDWFYSQEYYENWNRQYVMAWNQKAIDPRYSRFFETTIDYDPFTDYGLEINHRLFYYFLFVEKRLKIPILPPGTGPRSVL